MSHTLVHFSCRRCLVAQEFLCFIPLATGFLPSCRFSLNFIVLVVVVIVVVVVVVRPYTSDVTSGGTSNVLNVPNMSGGGVRYPT